MTAAIGQSTAIAARRGRSSGESATSACVPQIAAIVPAAPPIRPSSAPSNSVARTIAGPLAPSARDTAYSCSRCAARASSTDERFTISISASSTPAAASISSAGRTRSVRSAFMPVAYSFMPRLLKSRASIVRPIAATASATASGDAPRRARTIAE